MSQDTSGVLELRSQRGGHQRTNVAFTRPVTERAVVVLVALGVLACSPLTPGPPLEPSADAHAIYLVSHGWHVGLAVRRADVSPALWPESVAFGAVRYLEVGWGDGDYYPAVRGHPGLALKAAFSSTSSVLHVAGIDAPLTTFFAESSIIEVPLSTRGFDALIRFIHAAYARDAAGSAIVAGPGIYGASRFYRATGQYRLGDNSNHWTAKALAAAGCPIDPADMMTAGSLMDRASEFGRTLRPAGKAPGTAACR
jgi:uncharacterized protein (TIGR02117 family)